MVDRNGGAFSRTNAPEATFYAWAMPHGVFDSIPALLSGISAFDRIIDSSNVGTIQGAATVMWFTMVNGKNITDTNYLNIRTPDPLLRDAKGTSPCRPTRKAVVESKGLPVECRVTPNPGHPGFSYVPAGELRLRNDSLAEFRQRDTLGHQGRVSGFPGFVIRLSNVYNPIVGSGKVKATIKIYDLVGNFVTYQSTDNLLEGMQRTDQSSRRPPASQSTGTVRTRRAWRWRRGLYRAVVYITYPPNDLGFTSAKIVKKIGCR